LTIKYIGSKRLLLPRIEELVDGLGDIGTAADLFTGTTRVARMLKRRGLRVHANDVMAHGEVLGRTAIATDARTVDRDELAALLADLDATPPEPGYFTRAFCEQARYVHPDNGARIDAIRDRIERELPDEPLRSMALTSLLLAADRVDSTTGVQMAYLKAWAPRALKPLRLKMPELIDGPGSVSCMDASECARSLGCVDLAYIDPPYNQHSYLGNYHVWETLLRADRPESYGVANKRIDCKTRKSPWNSTRLISGAFRELVDAVDARWLLVSFNNEGALTTREVTEILATRGTVERVDVEHPRYVGARIGIHNPRGEKVGTVGHTRNTECLFLVRTDR
jgi:adenine-specific DNA-methyltransferase